MTSLLEIVSILFDFQILSCFVMSASRGLIESGAVSGNGTQFLFSDVDVRESDADLFHRPALGKYSIPSSIKLL